MAVREIHLGIEAFRSIGGGNSHNSCSPSHQLQWACIYCAPDCKSRQFAIAIAPHTVPATAACSHGADSGYRHEYAACLALTCICDSGRPGSAARKRMLHQASNLDSTTGASSLCSQMAESRRLGRVRRGLLGRSDLRTVSFGRNSPAMFRDSCSTFEPGAGKTAWRIIPWFQSWFPRTTRR
jgi:hypothetical protein